MASAFQYQFQPQPPPLPRTTGGKRGPSGPLTVSSSSEDEDCDLKSTTRIIDALPSPHATQIISVSNPIFHISNGSKVTSGYHSSKKDTITLVTENTISHSGLEASTSPSSPRLPAASPPHSQFAHELDHDYDNVSSPNSSTASGPIYIRPPGFKHHAQEVESLKSKLVRKKSRPAAVISLKDGFKQQDQTPTKVKPRRDPLPMRLRALPQSFWQQPNVAQQVSPANMFPVLPPLCNKDTEEDVTEVRPVTPPLDGDAERKSLPERKITVANTDLLFKLFENIDDKKSPATLRFKRGRPKRPLTKTATKGMLSGNDPYLLDAMADSLFPQLSIESSRHSGNSSLQLVTVGSGDKTVTLPSLTLEQNYPQMLSELVMHI